MFINPCVHIIIKVCFIKEAYSQGMRLLSRCGMIIQVCLLGVLMHSYNLFSSSLENINQPLSFFSYQGWGLAVCMDLLLLTF